MVPSQSARYFGSNPKSREREKYANVTSAQLEKGNRNMKKYLLVGVAVLGLAGPALAEDVGVRVGPVGAGVTVGESHDRDMDRDRDHDRAVIVKEHEPRDRTTIIKKDNDGVESKTVIHHDN
jgi:hypothetical protein